MTERVTAVTSRNPVQLALAQLSPLQNILVRLSLYLLVILSRVHQPENK